ncbi:DUF402 domain-containing protein [Streptomyces violaceusniger]
MLLWKPPAAWFSINAFFTRSPCGAHRLRNWYVNFEHPEIRTEVGFDTFDLAVDLVIAPDLAGGGRTKTSTHTCAASASSPTPSTRPSTPHAPRSSRCSRNARARSPTP